MTTKEIVSMIPLIEGTFSPKEATEIIETMVDDRVRFHSLQMLRMWEGNHKFDSSYWSKKIREMKEEKTVAKADKTATMTRLNRRPPRSTLRFRRRHS